MMQLCSRYSKPVKIIAVLVVGAAVAFGGYHVYLACA
jgi:hypothetical protein